MKRYAQKSARSFLAKSRIRPRRDGFTLIELLVSLSIFIVFLGIISQSYISIVRAQREANNVRKTYSEIRSLMENLAQDIRLNSPDYDCYEQNGDIQQCPADVSSLLLSGNEQYLMLVNHDHTRKTVYRYNAAKVTVQVKHYQKVLNAWQAEKALDPSQEDADGFTTLLSSAIKVKAMRFLLYPSKNPYSQAHYAENQYQFQPQVQVLLNVESSRDPLPPFVMNLQTSFSSRIYSRK